jgi:uncharacterized damage-inducible protein DinB
MPAQAAVSLDEREQLLGYLAQQRLYLRAAAHGLGDEEARAARTPSTLTVGGLVKHVAFVEEGWVGMVQQRGSGNDQDAYMENFQLGPEETLQSVLDRYADVAAESDRVLAGIHDLNQLVPVPKDVPWFPKDLDAWTVRWVILHLITETARHAGHADIVREAIDGATAYPLLAALEGWPATPWLQPWQPATS